MRSIFMSLFLLLPPAFADVDCRSACHSCHENKKPVEILEIYCAMCNECKARRKDRMRIKHSIARQLPDASANTENTEITSYAIVGKTSVYKEPSPELNYGDKEELSDTTQYIPEGCPTAEPCSYEELPTTTSMTTTPHSAPAPATPCIVQAPLPMPPPPPMPQMPIMPMPMQFMPCAMSQPCPMYLPLSVPPPIPPTVPPPTIPPPTIPPPTTSTTSKVTTTQPPPTTVPLPSPPPSHPPPPPAPVPLPPPPMMCIPPQPCCFGMPVPCGMPPPCGLPPAYPCPQPPMPPQAPPTQAAALPLLLSLAPKIEDSTQISMDSDYLYMYLGVPKNTLRRRHG